jgi:hypothetical protein
MIADSGDAPAMTIHATLDDTIDAGGTVERRAIPARSVQELDDEITSEVNVTAIKSLRGEAIMLHAAAIALDDGRVIGFVGPSGRGKTTAAHALGRAHRYVTDETLAILLDGSVVPFPKPLSVGDGPRRKQHTPASSMGLRPALGEELALAALVLLDRRPGVERPYVEQVPLTEALAELVPQSSYLSSLGRPLRSLAETVVATGGVRRVVYSEADTLPGLIDEILADATDEAPILADVPIDLNEDCGCYASPRSDESTADGSSAAPGTYQRTSTADALLIDDSLLVMGPNMVTVLEGLGPIVWLAASAATEEDIRDAALSQLPEPPEGIDTDEVVAAAIRELVDANLVTRS